MYIRGTQEEIRQTLIDAGIPPAEERNGGKLGPEHTFQVDVTKHFSALIGEPGFMNRDGVIWWAQDTPHLVMQVNKKTGRKFSTDGNRRKARGCIPGILDNTFMWGKNREGLWCELKAGKGKPEDEQIRFAGAMEALGFHTAFVWDHQGVEHIEMLLRRYGCPLIGRTSA